MISKEPTKSDIKMIQGLCVLAMVWLHLFCRESDNLFTPLIYFKGEPLIYYFAQLSDFCVFGFAFCSGYAQCTLFSENDYFLGRIKGIINLVVTYWLILVLFTLLSCLVGQSDKMPRDLLAFVMNFCMISHSFNGAWWYMLAYIVLSLLSPVILKMVHKNSVWTLGIGALIYIGAYYLRFYTNTDSAFLALIGPIGMTVFEYMIGALFCNKRYFSRIGKTVFSIPRLMRKIISIILVIFMLYSHTKIIASLFIAPITGIIIILTFYYWDKPEFLERIFGFMGKHSTNTWLVHMFFFQYIFIDLVYNAKYPLLIYIFEIMLCIIVSSLLLPVEKKIKIGIESCCAKRR